MDDRRFDALSRALGATRNRRGLLKATMAALVGSAGVAAVAGDAAARPRICREGGQYCTRNSQCCDNVCRTGKRVPKAVRNTCACAAGLTLCGKKCRDLTTDPVHCGGCNQPVDRETEICCNGEPTPNDEANCGTCGNVCGGEETCVDGVCEAPEPAAACVGGVGLGEACDVSSDCCSLLCSGGVCVAPDTDCSTYDGSNMTGSNGFGYCYVEAGQTLGVSGASDDLYCGQSAVPSGFYNLEPCTSREDCQPYADGVGRTDLIGICVTAASVCLAAGACKPLPIQGAQCEFLHSASSICP